MQWFSKNGSNTFGVADGMEPKLRRRVAHNQTSATQTVEQDMAGEFTGWEDPGWPAAQGSSLVSTYSATAFVLKGVLNSENSFPKTGSPSCNISLFDLKISIIVWSSVENPYES